MERSMRYRCHAAVIRGKITAPAIVTVGHDGNIVAEPEEPRELYSTRLYNGAIIAIPARLRSQLPATLPAHGFRDAVEALAPLSSGTHPVEVCFIPIKSTLP